MSTLMGRRSNLYRSNLYKRTIYKSEVSRAWCPAHMECCVAVGKSAQLRRALLLKGQSIRTVLTQKILHINELFITFGQWLSTQEQDFTQLSNTPGALELPVTPRVRILETFDLSTTNIEHFLEDDASVPVTPKLSALAPISELKSSSHKTIIA